MSFVPRGLSFAADLREVAILLRRFEVAGFVSEEDEEEEEE